MRAIGMSKLMTALFLLFVLSSCTGQKNSSEDAVITSSGQFLSLAEVIGSKFKERTGVRVNVKGTLGQEEELLKKGLTDVIISPQGVEGQGIENVLIAYDRIVLICNKSLNLQSLTKDQVAAIFSGKVPNWQSINGINQPIQIFSREPGATNREIFQEFFLPGNVGVSLNALIVNSNPEMKSAISSVKGSIGFVSIGAIDGSVMLVEVKDNQGNTIEIPKTKVLVSWNKNQGNKNVLPLIDFITSSKETKNILKSEGLIPSD
jgi:phosphate transport system substrate-binding protein